MSSCSTRSWGIMKFKFCDLHQFLPLVSCYSVAQHVAQLELVGLEKLLTDPCCAELSGTAFLDPKFTTISHCSHSRLTYRLSCVCNACQGRLPSQCMRPAKKRGHCNVTEAGYQFCTLLRAFGKSDTPKSAALGNVLWGRDGEVAPAWTWVERAGKKCSFMQQALRCILEGKLHSSPAPARTAARPQQQSSCQCAEVAVVPAFKNHACSYIPWGGTFWRLCAQACQNP